jgi:predicted DsbA family dithiol-disulfide isomerase
VLSEDGRPLVASAEQLGLDLDRFTQELRTHAGATRVAEDVDSADLSGVSGTPTFFIDGRRHYGAYNIATLSAAVRVAGAQALGTTTIPDSSLRA